MFRFVNRVTSTRAVQAQHSTVYESFRAFSQLKVALNIPNAPSTNVETRQVTAPWDNSVIGEIEVAAEEHIDAALANAHDIFRNKDAWIPASRRIEYFEKAIDLLHAEQEHFALEAAREGGKPLPDSRVEIARAIDGLKVCIEVMRNEQGEVVPMNFNAASDHRLAVTQREPIGVVAAVSAFNHPFNLIVHQVAAALAAGCPALVKPASDTPLSCYRFVDLMHRAGFPLEWVQFTPTGSNDVATKLVTDPRVSFFSFIGSGAVGWKLRTLLPPGTRCALEHGGVAPVIVHKDADLALAVPSIAKGAFYHAGQVCVSTQRAFVHKDISRQFISEVVSAANKMVIGDPTLATTEVGPIIRKGEADRVEAWVKEAVESGAELACGGNRLSDSTYECTVLVNPPADAKVTRDEVFGPVLCIYEYDDLDEAISRVNDVPCPFQGAVFTRDLDTSMRVYKRMNASAVMVNDHTAFRVDGMPFAGLGEAGYGVGGIPHTIKDMSIEKMLVIKSPQL